MTLRGRGGVGPVRRGRGRNYNPASFSGYSSDLNVGYGAGYGAHGSYGGYGSSGAFMGGTGLGHGTGNGGYGAGFNSPGLGGAGLGVPGFNPSAGGYRPPVGGRPQNQEQTLLTLLLKDYASKSGIKTGGGLADKSACYGCGLDGHFARNCPNKKM